MNNKVQCHLLEINLAGSCCFYCRILLGGILSCSPNSGKFLILSLHYSVIKTEITNSISSQSRNSLFRTTKIVQKEKRSVFSWPKNKLATYVVFLLFPQLDSFFYFLFWTTRNVRERESNLLEDQRWECKANRTWLVTGVASSLVVWINRCPFTSSTSSNDFWLNRYSNEVEIFLYTVQDW